MKKIILTTLLTSLLVGSMFFIVSNIFITESLALEISAPIAYAIDGRPITPTEVTEITIEVAIQRIFNSAFWLLLAVAGLFFMYGAYNFLYAGHDPEAAKKGKSVIVFAIIAIAVAVLARGLAEFIPRMLGVNT